MYNFIYLFTYLFAIWWLLLIQWLPQDSPDYLWKSSWPWMFREPGFVVMFNLKQVHHLLHIYSNNTDHITTVTPSNFTTGLNNPHYILNYISFLKMLVFFSHLVLLDKCSEQTLVVSYIRVMKQGLLSSILEMNYNESWLISRLVYLSAAAKIQI